MANPLKTIRFIGNVTSTTGGTVSWPFTDGLPNFEKFMDVLINVKTLSGGTSPTVTIAVQEEFSDVFATTATSTALTGTGTTFLTNASNPMLGKGIAKNFVLTTGGSPSALSVDLYTIFFSNN